MSVERDPLYVLAGYGRLGAPWTGETGSERVSLRPAQPAPQEDPGSVTAASRATPFAHAVNLVRARMRRRSDEQGAAAELAQIELGPASRYVTQYDYAHPERAPFMGELNVINPHPPGFPRPGLLVADHAARAYGPAEPVEPPRLAPESREAWQLER